MTSALPAGMSSLIPIATPLKNATSEIRDLQYDFRISYLFKNTEDGKFTSNAFSGQLFLASVTVILQSGGGVNDSIKSRDVWANNGARFLLLESRWAPPYIF